MVSRFAKEKNEDDVKQPVQCIVHDCFLFPVQSFSQRGVLSLCPFHRPSGTPEEWKQITSNLHHNKSLVDHYFRYLRTKRAVDLELRAQSGGHHPGLVVNDAASLWNKQPDENWHQYSYRYWGMLQQLIQAQRAVDHEPVRAMPPVRAQEMPVSAYDFGSAPY